MRKGAAKDNIVPGENKLAGSRGKGTNAVVDLRMSGKAGNGEVQKDGRKKTG
jgi:hypothetical protein